MHTINMAKAANTLLKFSGDDLQALLEVMTDYFTSPDEGRDSNNDEDGVPHLRNEHVHVLFSHVYFAMTSIITCRMWDSSEVNV